MKRQNFFHFERAKFLVSSSCNKKGDGLIESRTHDFGAFRHYLAVLDETRTVASLGDFKMALGVKFAIFTFFGGVRGNFGFPQG